MSELSEIERERALRDALEGVVKWLVMPHYCDHSHVVAASVALEKARAIIAASPQSDHKQPPFVGEIDADKYEEALRDPAIQATLSRAQPDHGPGEPSDADQAVVEAAAILRKLVLVRNPRVQEPKPVPLDVRIAAESWLAAYIPPIAPEADESALREIPEVYSNKYGTYWVKAAGRSREDAIALVRKHGDESPDLDAKIVHGREHEHPDYHEPWFTRSDDSSGEAFWEVSSYF